jgi:hypothetical protein
MTPAYALSTVGLHLLIAVGCLLCAAPMTTALRRGPALVGGAVALAVLAALLDRHSTETRVEQWQAAARARQCVGSQVVVCGPTEAGRLLTQAQASVQTALDTLAGSGIDWQRHYELAPDERSVPVASGQLSLQPEGMVHGRLGLDDVAYTLRTPRVCSTYFGDLPPQDLLDSQRVVMLWLDDRLAGRGSVRAPNAVRQAYERLRSCEPVAASARLPGRAG